MTAPRTESPERYDDTAKRADCAMPHTATDVAPLDDADLDAATGGTAIPISDEDRQFVFLTCRECGFEELMRRSEFRAHLNDPCKHCGSTRTKQHRSMPLED